MATTEIEATYLVSTPDVLRRGRWSGGRIAAPSFKGALRFWWRALAWSRLEGSLEQIKADEDKLFGRAGGGQSRVLMRLRTIAAPQTIGNGDRLTVSSRSRRVVGEGARYLGYGVIEAFASRNKGSEAGQLTQRRGLRALFEFTVNMRCRSLRGCLQSLENCL